MLTVNEQGFERFWGPSTIKPLNFNYEFQPTFTGQNIWTLTDNLFVTKQDGEANRAVKERNPKGAQKRSSKYKQFPSLDHDIHQKSSSAQGHVSGRLKVVGSPLERSQHSQKPSNQTKDLKKPRKDENAKFAKSPNEPSKQKPVQQKKAADKLKPAPPKFTLTKRPPQSGLTLKLSQQETEMLLKSLDFKVRTVRKTKPRDRSKSEALGRAKQAGAHKRLSVNKIDSRKPLAIKKTDLKKNVLENQELLKSSQMPSSSGKNSRSSSGLNELVGPLPRVNWTPEPIQQNKSSSASLKKKSSEKSGGFVGKGSKTSTSSKKLSKNQSESQDISREPSSEGPVPQQKVKTTRVKIIPKLTLNNQLLKSTTPKSEMKLPEKKAPPRKKEAKPKTDNSTLWTPEKLALLDQITNDQQLKAVLMSAGDTYMKTKKYFSVKSNLKTKPPVRQASSLKTPDLKKGVAGKPPSAATMKNPVKIVEVAKSPSKEEKSSSDPPEPPVSKPETAASKPDATQTNKKGEPKVVNNQLLKSDGVPKAAKTPKSPSRKVFNSQPSRDNKKTNVVVTNKKRPKYTIDSRQVRKVEERLAQLSAEVTVNSMKQDKKAAQAQRTNLDHLRKIIEKSMTNFKEENNKAGEIKSN